MATEVSEMLDDARETLAANIKALDDASTRCRQRLADDAANDKPYDEKMGSHLAWISAKVAEITTSLRLMEKHDKSMAKTPEQRRKLIFEYVRRELDPAGRQELMILLTEIDHGVRVTS